MTETGQDFEMWQGEKKVLDVADVNDDDYTGQTITWILADEEGATAEITKDNGTNGGVNIDTPSSGEFEITLDPDDTRDLSGRFYHEARIDDGGGTESVLFAGEAIIHQSGTA